MLTLRLCCRCRCLCLRRCLASMPCLFFMQCIWSSSAQALSTKLCCSLSFSLYLVLPVVALSLSLHPLSFALLCVCCVYFVVVVQVCGARVALGSRKQLICTLPKAAAAEAVAEAAAAATTAGIAATTTTTAKGMCAVGYSCVDFTQSFSSSSPHSA